MDFCYSREIYLTNMKNNSWILLKKQDYIDAIKTASKKLVHKAAEET